MESYFQILKKKYRGRISYGKFELKENKTFFGSSDEIIDCTYNLIDDKLVIKGKLKGYKSRLSFVGIYSLCCLVLMIKLVYFSPSDDDGAIAATLFFLFGTLGYSFILYDLTKTKSNFQRLIRN